MILLTVFLIIIAVLILLFGAVLFTPAEFGLEIIKTATKNSVYLRFKFLKIPFKIPLKQKNSNTKKKTVTKEEKFSFSKFKENVGALKKVYKETKDELRTMLSYTRNHITLQSVDFRIHFGFDNAAATGISTGAIWGMGSFILKVIDTLVGIKKINMKVDPDFDNKIFEIYSKTILIMKPINLIIILGQVLKTVNYVNNKINNINEGRV